MLYDIGTRFLYRKKEISVNTRIRMFFVAVLMAALGAIGLAGQAQAAPLAPGQTLTMEPYAECAWETPFVQQAKDLDWKIFQNGLHGTPGQNDWSCSYKVSISVPTGIKNEDNENLADGSDMNFLVPGLNTVTVPFNWAKTCDDQYPGAHIQWAGSNSSWPWPWICIGAPGVSYNQYDINTPPASDAWKLEILDK